MRIDAFGDRMKRLFWLIFGALTLAAASLLLRFPPESLARNTPAPKSLPDVRVEHEFVTVSIAQIPAASNTQPRGVIASPASERQASNYPVDPPRATTEAAVPEKPVQRASRDRTLLGKAGRAFLGDGRHRPEPFPRVRDN